MLSTNVKTTSDLMSIALEAEREAIRRYTKLVSMMRKGNNESSAALFERMVTEEVEHERLLLEWMEQEGIEVNSQIEPISWSDPNVSTTYNDEAHDPFFSSPYKALAFAVHNEEIAFRFYTHVAANSDNETVRKYAEILAKEELGHAALLRAERRYAYHAERESKPREPRLDPQAVHNEADLLTAAIHINRYLAEQMHSISKNKAEMNLLATKTEQQISKFENDLKTKTPPSKDILENINQLKQFRANEEQSQDEPDIELQRLWSCCDRSFAFYDSIVETATNEELLLAAQELTSLALEKIGELKKMYE
ncbi:MAG: ferritin family protein [Gammaproteobacteria bacterium]|nr:ferritin family protein [Gammaproteobacteria bacterium]